MYLRLILLRLRFSQRFLSVLVMLLCSQSRNAGKILSRRFTSDSIRVPFFQFDSFSPTLLGGNPCAVLLLPPELPPPDDSTLTKIAAENALSETAYISPLGHDPIHGFGVASTFDLRWFTPTKEVTLCGHGTLAAAAAVFRSGNPHSSLTFRTLSGELVASRDSASGDTPLITLDFPLNPPNLVAAAGDEKDNDESVQIRELADFFLHETGPVSESSRELDVVRLAHCPTTKKLVVHCRASGAGLSSGSSSSCLEALSALQDLKVPSSDRVLQAHDGSVVTGVSVVVAGPASALTAAGGGNSLSSSSSSSSSSTDKLGAYHFFSRYFSPWNGIPEDPVNGSSHTVLAPYWATNVLGWGAGDERTQQQTMTARQASPRGGDLILGPDFSKGRVTIAGPAALVIEGSMVVPVTSVGR